MAKRSRHSKILVIDASIARSASGPSALDPIATHCGDCLTAVLEICHHVILTPEIREEWDRHQSNFTAQWRSSMIARKKVHLKNVAPDATLRERLNTLPIRDKDKQAILKDARLVEAALAADQTILSRDDSVRDLLAQVSFRITSLKAIVWVNPINVEENCLTWLQEGAQPEKHRQIGFTPADTP